MSTRCLGQPGFAVERHCEMRCERDALQDALQDAMEEMRQTLKLNTKDSIPGIATTRSIGLVKRQPAPSYGLGAAKPRVRRAIWKLRVKTPKFLRTSASLHF